MHTINATFTQEMLTKPLLLMISAPEINQINHLGDVVDLLHSITKHIVCYAKVILILTLLKKNLMQRNTRYQISEVSTIIRKTKKCKMHETLKKEVAERADSLAVELAAKLSYASCICAKGAKYHRDCRSRLFQVKSTIITLSVPVDLTTFVIVMSLPKTVVYYF